jgi:hypothetical protein
MKNSMKIYPIYPRPLFCQEDSLDARTRVEVAMPELTENKKTTRPPHQSAAVRKGRTKKREKRT